MKLPLQHEQPVRYEAVGADQCGPVYKCTSDQSVSQQPKKLITSFLYQARARSARALRACALRALGLLLADGTPTVGGGMTF